MFKLFKFVLILFLGVICCACMNTAAVQELNKKAADYLEAGDIETAISRLESSIDLDGNIYESRYNLAVAYMQKKECQKALDNIRIATTLIKNEPAVNYTHGVSAMCVAEKILYTKNQFGDLEEVVFQTYDRKQEAIKRYVELITEANQNFNIYLKLAPTAEDSQDVISIVRKNEAKIAELTDSTDTIE